MPWDINSFASKGVPAVNNWSSNTPRLQKSLCVSMSSPLLSGQQHFRLVAGGKPCFQRLAQGLVTCGCPVQKGGAFRSWSLPRLADIPLFSPVRRNHGNHSGNYRLVRLYVKG
jgi:hypothetical protein